MDIWIGTSNGDKGARSEPLACFSLESKVWRMFNSRRWTSYDTFGVQRVMVSPWLDLRDTGWHFSILLRRRNWVDCARSPGLPLKVESDPHKSEPPRRNEPSGPGIVSLATREKNTEVTELFPDLYRVLTAFIWIGQLVCIFFRLFFLSFFFPVFSPV